MRNFLRALPERLLGQMHLSVQQIKHCSGGHILPSLPLWLSLPVSWCPLAPAHHIIYSPITLHDYYTDNMKLNYSPSLAGKWTTWRCRGMMKHSPLSLFLLFLWKEKSYRILLFFLLYKAKFYFSSSFKKKISSTVTFQLQHPNIASQKHQYIYTDRSEPVQQSELLQVWDGIIWAVPGHAVNLFSQTPSGMDLCSLLPCPIPLSMGRWQQLRLLKLNISVQHLLGRTGQVKNWWGEKPQGN